MTAATVAPAAPVGAINAEDAINAARWGGTLIAHLIRSGAGGAAVCHWASVVVEQAARWHRQIARELTSTPHEIAGRILPLLAAAHASAHLYGNYGETNYCDRERYELGAVAPYMDALLMIAAEIEELLDLLPDSDAD
jgi:hypothetical protein